MNKDELTTDGTNNNANGQTVPKMEVENLAGPASPDVKDEDGVWSADIEQAFKESLQIYPPCGRRKIILSEEGKMYGRNEMIARYILLKTGKKRTRKQVSSHIQVLARRMQREKQGGTKGEGSPVNIADATREIISRVPRETYQNPGSEVPQSVSHHSRAPEIQSYLGNSQLHLNAFNVQVSQQKEEISVDDSFDDRGFTHTFLALENDQISINESESISIMQLSDKFHSSDNSQTGLLQMYETGPKDSFYLIKFWADLRFEEDPDMTKSYEMNTIFETAINRQIEVQTAAYSFGEEAVSKCEMVRPIEPSTTSYKFEVNTPLCRYGTGFIERLLDLRPERAKMDKVLEHFTVLHTLRDANTNEILLVLALVFAVSDGSNDQGSTYHIYKLKP